VHQKIPFDDQLIRLEARNTVHRPPGEGDSIFYWSFKIVIHRQMKISAGDGDAA
jgi:hypothetical protein